MRLGLMGGTFDPIHNAHLLIADAARTAVGLEQVLFIPSGNPPHKAGMAAAEDRAAMTELAVRDLPWARASRVEIERPGVIYTVDTLECLSKERPGDGLFVIVGADALRDMRLWRNARRAMELCELIAMPRPGMSDQELAEAKRAAREETGARVTLVKADSPDISSSMIRALAARGESLKGMVPPAVEAYIYDRGIYR